VLVTDYVLRIAKMPEDIGLYEVVGERSSHANGNQEANCYSKGRQGYPPAGSLGLANRFEFYSNGGHLYP
jgi:hypothetical protein